MKKTIPLMLLLATLFLASCASKSNYATGTIDMGVVVKDVDASIKFYEKLGFTKFGEFNVPKEVAGDAGLLNYKAANIKVMTLNGDAADTKLKLIASRTAKTTANAFIDSSLGISYITLFVKDAGLTLANLKKHNIKVTAKGPVDLTPVGFQPNFLIVIQDPDGNFIEFVGPILTK